MARTIDHMFGSFEFRKSTEEIKKASLTKIEKLKAKITERERRIAALRKEHDIEDSDLIQLLKAARKNAAAQTYTYSKSMSSTQAGQRMTEERIIGAGVVNNLLTESDFIEAELDQIKVLERIIRNLNPLMKFSENGSTYTVSHFKLTPEELDYLEF